MLQVQKICNHLDCGLVCPPTLCCLGDGDLQSVSVDTKDTRPTRFRDYLDVDVGAPTAGGHHRDMIRRKFLVEG